MCVSPGTNQLSQLRPSCCASPVFRCGSGASRDGRHRGVPGEGIADGGEDGHPVLGGGGGVSADRVPVPGGFLRAEPAGESSAGSLMAAGRVRPGRRGNNRSAGWCTRPAGTSCGPSGPCRRAAGLVAADDAGQDDQRPDCRVRRGDRPGSMAQQRVHPPVGRAGAGHRRDDVRAPLDRDVVHHHQEPVRCSAASTFKSRPEAYRPAREKRRRQDNRGADPLPPCSALTPGWQQWQASTSSPRPTPCAGRSA
jgi:hypothetical protein